MKKLLVRKIFSGKRVKYTLEELRICITAAVDQLQIFFFGAEKHKWYQKAC